MKHEWKTMVVLSTADSTSGLKTPPSSRNRHSAIVDNRKNEYNFVMVHARQEICIEH
jgi:hypothetical protein